MIIEFRGIDITREGVLHSLEEFHQEFPDTNSYENWLDKGSYIYAIYYQDKLYPPKHILSVVSGIPTTEFSGGEQTNRMFRQLGFVVVRK
jgi:5-methylcytosine-specific restriction enzyme A